MMRNRSDIFLQFGLAVIIALSLAWQAYAATAFKIISLQQKDDVSHAILSKKTNNLSSARQLFIKVE